MTAKMTLHDVVFEALDNAIDENGYPMLLQSDENIALDIKSYCGDELTEAADIVEIQKVVADYREQRADRCKT